MAETTATGPDLAPWVRPGDTIVWGQATAEPRTLTHALVAQRHAFARLRVFVGIGASPTLQPEHADAFDFVGYSASGTHRALADAEMAANLTCFMAALLRDRHGLAEVSHGLLCSLQKVPAAKMALTLQKHRERVAV
mgnify:CR=1 FL=1